MLSNAFRHQSARSDSEDGFSSVLFAAQMSHGTASAPALEST